MKAVGINLHFQFRHRNLRLNDLHGDSITPLPSATSMCVRCGWNSLKRTRIRSSLMWMTLITARTKNQCLNGTRTALQIIEQTGFMVNPPKAQLCKSTVQYLGLELNAQGRCPDVDRIQLIRNLLIPSNITTLCSFLGLVGFLRDFIEGYASKAAPLY